MRLLVQRISRAGEVTKQRSKGSSCDSAGRNAVNSPFERAECAGDGANGRAKEEAESSSCDSKVTAQMVCV